MRANVNNLVVQFQMSQIFIEIALALISGKIINNVVAQKKKW